jgi:hypothetical protein
VSGQRFVAAPTGDGDSCLSGHPKRGHNNAEWKRSGLQKELGRPEADYVPDRHEPR